jgi:beta-glucanase (GH16 family)
VTANALGRRGSAAAKDEWRLVWCDEFDGPEGAPADPAFWTHEVGDGSVHGNPGWGNGELEYYTAGTENAALDGRGNLVVTARREPSTTDRTCYYGRCEYTSARLITKGKLEQTHGRVEARIRVPRGSGLWPAFWALGANIDEVGWPASGEIDIMEHVGREPRRVIGALHGPGYSGSEGIAQVVDLPQDVADDFHVFAVEWHPGRIVWTVDGTEFHRVTPADVAPNDWPFDQPFYLLLNVAVGGHLGGEVGEATIFPARMLVDYVRVWAHGTTV